MGNYYSATDIFNWVYSGNTLASWHSQADILNFVYNESENALNMRINNIDDINNSELLEEIQIQMDEMMKIIKSQQDQIDRAKQLVKDNTYFTVTSTSDFPSSIPFRKYIRKKPNNQVFKIWYSDYESYKAYIIDLIHKGNKLRYTKDSVIIL